MLQGKELVHILLAELMTAVFFVWLAVEAVYHENAFELLASAVVACGIAARFIFFMVSFGRSSLCSPHGILGLGSVRRLRLGSSYLGQRKSLTSVAFRRHNALRSFSDQSVVHKHPNPCAGFGRKPCSA